MRSAIAESFGELDGGSTIFPGDVASRATPPSWGYCVGIDYSQQDCLATEGHFLCQSSSQSVKRQLRALRLNQCNRDDGEFKDTETCRAVWALLETFSKLTPASPCGPAFKNYAATNWGETTPPELSVGWPSPRYLSWREGGFSLAKAAGGAPNGTWEELPAPWHAGNAANGFALCDIVHTVLQQNNNQAGTGTCGPSAVLAALNSRRPARAMRYAAELFWTGAMSALPQAPCPYIYQMFPGLVDIPSPNQAYKNCIAAGGNPSDCSQGNGLPYNPMGLQGMWAQALLSSYTNYVNSQFFSASEVCNATSKLLLNLPTNTPAESTATRFAQMSAPATIQYLCTNLIGQGQSCRWHVNTEICQGQLSDKDCTQLTALPGLIGADMGVLEGVLTGSSTLAEALESPRVQAFVRSVGESAAAAGSQVEGAVEAIFSVVKPSLSAEELEAACEAETAMLFVWADPLNYWDAASARATDYRQVVDEEQGSCDHWVFLESCDAAANVYTIFTWGYRLSMTKELLLGNATGGGHTSGLFCGAVTF